MSFHLEKLRVTAPISVIMRLGTEYPAVPMQLHSAANRKTKSPFTTMTVGAH